jgi:Uma2 family endonuclease
MTVKTRATLHDLHLAEGKAELVNGEVVLMSPTGGRPGRAGDLIFASLLAHERRTGFGTTVGDNKGFTVRLPHRESFSPDAAYFVGPDPGMGFYESAPAFAVEVRSQGDYGPAAERAMAEKRADYFAAGTLVVWDVDLLSDDVVRVYRPNSAKSPAIYRRGDTAEADPAVPGWTMAVNDLFPD